MGGMAFKNTQRILAQDVIPTVKRIAVDLGLDQTDLVESILGSAGKKESSGDIDLNMDRDIHRAETMLPQLISAYGGNNVKQRGAMICTSVPVRSEQRVQVDFMFGITEWQKFSYWSSEKSIYKGLYRTELLKALTAFKSDWTKSQDGQLIARIGPTFFHDRGAVWRYRWKTINRKTGAFIKDFKEPSAEEFLKTYPEAIAPSRESITDIHEFMQFIFGSITHNDNSWVLADSYESLLSLCRSNYSLLDQNLIGKIYFERLNSLGVDIPSQIQTDWLG